MILKMYGSVRREEGKGRREGGGGGSEGLRE